MPRRYDSSEMFFFAVQSTLPTNHLLGHLPGINRETDSWTANGKQDYNLGISLSDSCLGASTIEESIQRHVDVSNTPPPNVHLYRN